MKTRSSTGGRGTARRTTTLGAALLMAAAAGGCDSLLDVENPNNVVQEDLEAATSVNALVNGALALLSDAIATSVQASIVVSDEAFWVGSQNALRELDNGELLNLDNDYSPFPDFSESRWLAAQAVEQAELHASELPRPADRARAHFYLGVNYASIADLFDDFVFSDMREASPPIGEANMGGLYDEAIEEYTVALEAARATGATSIERGALAMRARAHWAKALWEKLNPAGTAPSDPWINSAAANADARAALELVGEEPNWAFELAYSNATVTNAASSNMNRRLEFRIHHRWATPTASDKQIEAVTYPDIIDDAVSATLDNRITAFIEGGQFSDIELVSARELRLILAEAAFASGDEAEAVALINANRALDGLTPYDPAVHTSVTLEEVLKHERITNLFFMAHRRWADLYRFDEESPEWIEAGPAAVAPGTFFPIHRDEQLSNCYILGTCG